MRDPNRIAKVLDVLGRYWMQHPDLRLGQIVSNAHDDHCTSQDRGVNHDVFYFEDEDLVKTIESQIDFESKIKDL